MSSNDLKVTLKDNDKIVSRKLKLKNKLWSGDPNDKPVTREKKLIEQAFSSN